MVISTQNSTYAIIILELDEMTSKPVDFWVVEDVFGGYGEAGYDVFLGDGCQDVWEGVKFLGVEGYAEVLALGD